MNSPYLPFSGNGGSPSGSQNLYSGHLPCVTCGHNLYDRMYRLPVLGQEDAIIGTLPGCELLESSIRQAAAAMQCHSASRLGNLGRGDRFECNGSDVCQLDCTEPVTGMEGNA
jgi:hypothetical protein